MKMEAFEKRAGVSQKIRTSRDKRHTLFQLDNPKCTFTLKDLAPILGFATSKQMSDRLSTLEKKEGYTFNRALNRNFALTAKDVWWLCEYLNIPHHTNKERMGFVLNIMNLKGGVGKSTTTNMVADGLTLDIKLITKQLRVCIIDLDPQGSATKQALGDFKPGDLFTSAITLMYKEPSKITKEQIKKVSIIQTGNENLDIIPCTTDDGFLAPVLAEKAAERGEKVHDLLQTHVIDHIKDEYDVILVDAGPHLDDVFISALGASDGTLTPVPPKELDFDSTLKFTERLPEIFQDMIDVGYNLEKLQFSKAFMNMWAENPASVAGQVYNTNAKSELVKIFGREDSLYEQLPNDTAYQHCANVQKTIFSISASTFSKELGTSKSYSNSKVQASKWLGCVWEAIELAYDKEAA